MKAFIGTFVLLLLCSFPAPAKNHIVASIANCAWLTMHIVVVTEGDEIDGHVTVLESLQGDLKTGDTLDIPELAKFKSEQSRHVECINNFAYLEQCPADTSQFVSGSKIILLLNNQAAPSESAKWSALGAVWIEQGNVYGLYDGEKDWDGTLTRLDTEEGARTLIARVIYEKAALKSAMEIEDINARIDALQPLAQSSVYYTAQLANAGINALKNGKSLRSDEPKPSDFPKVNCEGNCTGAIFSTFLKKELEHWQAIAPHLKPGWWNDPTMDRDELQADLTHIAFVEVALGALNETGDARETKIVRELRDYFLSLPQLKDQTLILKACGSLLNGN